MDFIKIEKFCSLKDTYKQIKRQDVDWEKIFTNLIPSEVLYPEDFFKSIKSVRKQTKKNFLNGLKIWTHTLPNKIHRWQTGKWEIVQYSNSLEKWKLKPQWAATTHQPNG